MTLVFCWRDMLLQSRKGKTIKNSLKQRTYLNKHKQSKTEKVSPPTNTTENVNIAENVKRQKLKPFLNPIHFPYTLRISPF